MTAARRPGRGPARARRCALAVIAVLISLAGPASLATGAPARPGALAPPRAAAGWSGPRAIDQIAPLTQPFIGTGSCVSTSFCAVAGVDAVAISTHPAAGPQAWHTTLLPGPVRMVTISCPSTRECVGSFGFGWLAVSTDPTGGARAWRSIRVPGVTEVNDLNCASVRLCVLVGSGRRVAWSASPTHGLGAWHTAHIRGASDPQSVSCPSAGLCVAADNDGDLEVSRDPLAGARSWRIVKLRDSSLTLGVTCPSTKLCVGSDGDNRLLVSTDPAGGRRAWHFFTLFRHGSGDLDQPVCPSVSYCIVGNGSGTVWTSTHPARGRRAWHRHSAHFPAGVIACAGVRACLAVNQDGQIAATSDPLRPSRWRRLLRIGGNDIEAVACPSRSLCVAGDDAGNLLSAAGPRARHWHDTGFARALRRRYGGEEQVLGVACATASSCLATVVAADDQGNEGQLYAFDPHRVAATLRPVALRAAGTESPEYVSRLTCPMRSLCGLVDHLTSGRAVRLISTDPTDPASWTPHGGGPQLGSACPSPTRCLAPAGHGDLALLARRGRRFVRTGTVKALSEGPLNAVSCGRRAACAAVGPSGVAVSDDPTVSSSWRFAANEPLGLHTLSAACAAPSACVAVGMYGKAVSTVRPLSRARPSRRRRP